jgi:ABC-2 type transport system ATP-binding protein
MIKTQGLCKAFNKLEAIRNIDICVKEASIYGLVGSNGAGKTTLLKILTGIYRQDGGSALIASEEIFENLDTKSKLFFIPDNPTFLPQYTIYEMAKYYSRIYTTWSWERYEKLKSAFPINPSKRIHTLSKGMQRQVAFWLAISVMPEVLLLDEPFDGLDPVMRSKVKNLIIQDVAERNMTVVISSHNLRELEDLCDYIGILHQGQIILERELDDMKSDIHKVQVAFDSTVDLSTLKNVKILYEENRGSIRIFIARAPKQHLIEELQRLSPLLLDILPLSLEEIFIYEMGDIGYEIKNILL